MTYKYYSYKDFKGTINNKNYLFTCCSQNTSYGFRHLCFYKNNQISKTCYYNRTWERFEYQTVLEQAIEKLNVSAEAINPFVDSMTTKADYYDLLQPVEKKNGYDLLGR